MDDEWNAAQTTVRHTASSLQKCEVKGPNTVSRSESRDLRPHYRHSEPIHAAKMRFVLRADEHAVVEVQAVQPTARPTQLSVEAGPM